MEIQIQASALSELLRRTRDFPCRPRGDTITSIWLNQTPLGKAAKNHTGCSWSSGMSYTMRYNTFYKEIIRKYVFVRANGHLVYGRPLLQMVT